MSAIAHRVGGSKSALWAGFRSKDVLFAVVLESLTIKLAEGLQDILRPKEDIRTTLVSFAACLLTTTLSPAALQLERLIIADGAHYPAACERHHDVMYGLVKRQLCSFLVAQKASTAAIIPDFGYAADQLLDLLYYNRFQYLLLESDRPSPLLCEKYAKDAIDFFLRTFAFPPNQK